MRTVWFTVLHKTRSSKCIWVVVRSNLCGLKCWYCVNRSMISAPNTTTASRGRHGDAGCAVQKNPVKFLGQEYTVWTANVTTHDNAYSSVKGDWYLCIRERQLHVYCRGWDIAMIGNPLRTVSNLTALRHGTDTFDTVSWPCNFAHTINTHADTLLRAHASVRRK